MKEYKPETVPAAFRDRKSRLDAAIDGEERPTGMPKPEPKNKATGLPKPKPGIIDRIKSMVTGKEEE